MDWKRILPDVVELARASGNLALTIRADLQTTQKPDGSLVTLADQQIESMLRQTLTALVPGTTVWGEEEGFDTVGDAGIWLVDPIDGTSNFVFGGPLWGVSIALLVGEEMVLGVIYLPDLDRMYAATLGSGATCNGTPMRPIRPGEIDPTELVSYSDHSLLSYQEALPGKMRYLGAWVAESAWFVEGWCRGVISWRTSLYDIAASIVIAKEVGAQVRYADPSVPLLYSELLGVSRMENPIVLLPAGSTFALTTA